MGFAATIPVILLLFVISGCTVAEAQKQLAYPLPEYLSDIYPPPFSVVSSALYHERFDSIDPFAGIRATLSGLSVDEPVFEPPPPLPERLTLWVDDVEVPRDFLTTGDGLMEYQLSENDVPLGTVYDGPYYLSWKYPLAVGVHRALLVIESNTGKIFEYGWQFEVRP